MESQKPDQESSDFGFNADIGEIKPQDIGKVSSESQAEESKAQEVEVEAEAKSHPEEEEKNENTSSAQVEDTVHINNIQEDLERQPEIDAASFNKGGSEVKVAVDLGEDSLTGTPKGGEIQAVEEEVKKADEQSISEVPLQD